MVFGSLAGIHDLMPYWLMVTLAVVKPVVTLLLLGPPTGTLPLLQVDGGSEEAQSRLAVLKREAPGAVFLAMAVAGLVSLAYKSFKLAQQSDGVWQGIPELLLLLGNAPGLGSMLNLVALVGLYDRKRGRSVQAALLGRGAAWEACLPKAKGADHWALRNAKASAPPSSR